MPLGQLMRSGGILDATAIERAIIKAGNRLLEPASFKEMYQIALTNLERKLQISRLSNWIRDSEDHCNFTFDQGAWGDAAILGGGICFAINYDWIKAQTAMHRMDQTWEPRRVQDFALRLNKEALSGQVTREQRVHQAASQLEVRGGKQQTIPESLLKRDRCQYEPIMTPAKGFSPAKRLVTDSVEELIDNLAARETRKGDPGLYDIGAFGKSDGHALDVRIDKVHERYSFWDVNGGYWSYSSLEEMWDGFASYLACKYTGDEQFTAFETSRYTPTEKTWSEPKAPQRSRSLFD